MPYPIPTSELKNKLGIALTDKLLFLEFWTSAPRETDHIINKKTPTPVRIMACRWSLIVLKINIINFQKPEHVEDSITIARMLTV